MMFYSQIILAKKGPLGKIWQAAHWGDKKLGRPAVFSTNIETAVDHIVDPSIPLALRVSSHLLWGVVRIYSRQVQYLLDDCQQAMTKVSFVNHHHPHGHNGKNGPNSTTKIDLAITSKQQNNLNVSNFAEHVPTDGPVVDFAIPFIEDTDEADWVPAELPDEDTTLHIPQHNHRDRAEAAEDKYDMNDEQWGGVEFDPDDENATDSTGSIVEKPRAAAQSEGNQSNILTNVDTSNEVSKNMIPEDDGGVDFPQGDDDLLPFDDDADGVGPPPDDSSLHEAGIVDITNSRDQSNSTLNIGFGDSPVQKQVSVGDDDDNDDENTAKKRKSLEVRKTKKKRRKIVTDNSELPSDHIRLMLDDTSRTMMKESDREPAKPERSIEEDFYLPCMEHDLLPDAVLAVWRNNISMAMGKSIEYEMKSNDNEEDELAAPVEVPREADPTNDADMPQVEANDESFPVDDDQQPQDDDAIPFDNDEQPAMDDGMPPMDHNQFSSDDDNSVFSLGATNDLQEDIEIDEPVGSTKWHKNTIKVFEVLKHNLQENNMVSFQTLSKGATRRTAAGLFFEMLQLKTLNYIEVDQDQSFGDIVITQGVRFDEDIST